MKKFLKNYWFILCMLAGIVAGCLVEIGRASCRERV